MLTGQDAELILIQVGCQGSLDIPHSLLRYHRAADLEVRAGRHQLGDPLNGSRFFSPQSARRIVGRLPGRDAAPLIGLRPGGELACPGDQPPCCGLLEFQLAAPIGARAPIQFLQGGRGRLLQVLSRGEFEPLRSQPITQGSERSYVLAVLARSCCLSVGRCHQDPGTRGGHAHRVSAVGVGEKTQCDECVLPSCDPLPERSELVERRPDLPDRLIRERG